MCSLPGYNRCGMGSNFVLGKFTAAECGTAAVRFVDRAPILTVSLIQYPATSTDI